MELGLLDSESHRKANTELHQADTGKVCVCGGGLNQSKVNVVGKQKEQSRNAKLKFHSVDAMYPFYTLK